MTRVATAIVLVILISTSIALTGCVENGEKTDSKETDYMTRVIEAENLTVDMKFEVFPRVHTCDGADLSPEISIVGLDDSVVSMALILDDPDAPKRTFVHWVVWNLDPVETIPGALPKMGQISEPIDAVQGTNDFGRIGYNGPCPPPGKPHRYHLKVYGLDSKLDLSAGSDVVDLEEAMNGHIVQMGKTEATYGR